MRPCPLNFYLIKTVHINPATKRVLKTIRALIGPYFSLSVPLGAAIIAADP